MSDKPPTPTPTPTPTPSAAESSDREDTESPTDAPAESQGRSRRLATPSGFAFERVDAPVEAPALEATVFEDWDQFFGYLSAYQAKSFQRFRLRTTTSVEERNRRIQSSPASTARIIPAEWGSYSKTLVCTHAGKYQYRGTGKRKWHETRPIECKARMNVVLQWRGNRFMVVVTKAVLSHNHVLSHTVYKQYAAVRVAGDDALTANGPATQHDDELQTPEADHSVSSPVTATPTASSTTMTMTTAGSSFVAEATTASPNVVVESRRVPGPRPIECFVLSFEREWEPILSLWAKDALTFSHDRMLAAVDQTLTPVVASQQKEGGPARVPVFVDVGCATGALSLAFADKFDASRGHSVLDGSVSEAERSLRHARIIATDIADGMLDRITDKLNAYPTSQSLQARVTTVQMDGQLLDKLEDGSVDIVGSNFGLSIFPDRVKSWRSAARVLRDGGLLFATAWDAQTAIIRWMDGCVQLARRSSLSRGSAQFAEREEHRSVALPSAMMGFEMVVGELEASGFADVEVFRTRHSVVFSSPRALVDSMLASPELAGFLDRIPRERLADYLYGALVKEGTFTINSRQGDESQLSFEDVKWSSRPVTVDFVANIFVASRSRRAAAHPTSGYSSS